MSQTQRADGPQPAAVIVSRCSDVDRAIHILEQDLKDPPLCFLSRKAIESLARAWTRHVADIALLNAEVGGAYAGFVLAQARGRRFWRSVVQEHPASLGSFAVAWARTRLRHQAGPHLAAGAPVDVPALDRPFEWSTTPGVSMVEYLFVHPSFRGRRVAPALLMEAERQMRAAGATSIEAHVDGQNYASVRAFLTAGWDVFRMTTDDFYTSKDLTLPPQG
jgi:GNAT superfamily N-acetyltransferase